jgi:hypothetical protein
MASHGPNVDVTVINRNTSISEARLTVGDMIEKLRTHMADHNQHFKQMDEHLKTPAFKALDKAMRDQLIAHRKKSKDTVAKLREWSQIWENSSSEFEGVRGPEALVNLWRRMSSDHFITTGFMLREAKRSVERQPLIDEVKAKLDEKE